MNDTAVHTIYSGRSTNWPMICLSIALVLPLVALAKGSNGSWSAVGFLIPLLVVVAAAAANLLTATSLRTTAGPNGITVHCGALGWPRFGTRCTASSTSRRSRFHSHSGREACIGGRDEDSC